MNLGCGLNQADDWSQDGSIQSEKQAFSAQNRGRKMLIPASSEQETTVIGPVSLKSSPQATT